MGASGGFVFLIISDSGWLLELYDIPGKNRNIPQRKRKARKRAPLRLNIVPPINCEQAKKYNAH
jgi:hypothetical protein